MRADFTECDQLTGVKIPCMNQTEFKDMVLAGDEVAIGTKITMTLDDMFEHLIHLRVGNRAIFDFNPRLVFTFPEMCNIYFGVISYNRGFRGYEK